jgi:hypothetical protein
MLVVEDKTSVVEMHEKMNVIFASYYSMQSFTLKIQIYT